MVAQVQVDLPAVLANACEDVLLLAVESANRFAQRNRALQRLSARRLPSPLIVEPRKIQFEVLAPNAVGCAPRRQWTQNKCFVVVEKFDADVYRAFDQDRRLRLLGC
ncbi:MAG TPA: hypothetical protein VN812_19520 [Candidatus Acidoferrales bacterium]|nr:hypothetical protein [Candidatus Acidoferrales bacterium]